MRRFQKGRRTYITIAAIVLVAVAGAVESGPVFLSPEVTTATIAVLGALAAYFRKAA